MLAVEMLCTFFMRFVIENLLVDCCGLSGCTQLDQSSNSDLNKKCGPSSTQTIISPTVPRKGDNRLHQISRK